MKIQAGFSQPEDKKTKKIVAIPAVLPVHNSGHKNVFVDVSVDPLKMKRTNHRPHFILKPFVTSKFVKEFNSNEGTQKYNTDLKLKMEMSFPVVPQLNLRFLIVFILFYFFIFILFVP